MHGFTFKVKKATQIISFIYNIIKVRKVILNIRTLVIRSLINKDCRNFGRRMWLIEVQMQCPTC